MYYQLANLTSIYVVAETENVLQTYPEYPYQAAFTIAYWKQRLIAYVLSRVPNRYVVIKATEDIANKSNLEQITEEVQLCIENAINMGIITLLRENPDWKKQQFSVQDLSSHVLNLEILSQGSPRSIPVVFPDGGLFLTLKKEQFDCNLVSYSPVPITDNQHIIGKHDCGEALQQLTNQILIEQLRKLEQSYEQLSRLYELNDCLLMSQTPIAIYRTLNKLVPLLLPETKGGIFKLNFLNNCVESLATWGVLNNSELSLITQDFWAFYQGYLHQGSRNESGLFSTHIHRQPNAGDSQCISLISRNNSLEFFYIANEHPNPLTLAQQKLTQVIVKKTAFSLSKLLLQEDLQDQAVRDPLTNLFNRRYLEETLQKKIAQATSTRPSIGVIMIDVDHFKKINDTFGHKFGDLALQALARCLQKNVRASDIVCRYGGEEFVIIFPDISVEDLVNRAEDIRQKVNQLTIFDHSRSTPMITVSLGVASFPNHGYTYDQLMLSADRALYRAKQLGRNCTVIAACEPQ